MTPQDPDATPDEIAGDVADEDTAEAEAEAHLLATWADQSLSRDVREAAFRDFVERFRHRVFAICLREVGSRADAEEVTQDTFAKVARSADGFRGDSKVSTWVYRIAVNACRDLQRHHGRRPSVPVADIEVALARGYDGTDEVADIARGVELSDALAGALDELDELSYRLLMLCAVRGMTYPEAGELLDMPVGTIKSRVFRARAQLAETLAATGVRE